MFFIFQSVLVTDYVLYYNYEVCPLCELEVKKMKKVEERWEKRGRFSIVSIWHLGLAFGDGLILQLLLELFLESGDFHPFGNIVLEGGIDIKTFSVGLKFIITKY